MWVPHVRRCILLLNPLTFFYFYDPGFSHRSALCSSSSSVRSTSRERTHPLPQSSPAPVPACPIPCPGRGFISRRSSTSRGHLPGRD
ncbi:hypothetical protein BRADI_5g18042v3 [Brachypodium distachyon]|uniref:Uncharacterized protein n=1 Tax=Brachypodium distachyon TaxID=15368 RepID=A0A0Q3E7X8_BRADI|nr:hypothetical protein BRADI_5g18042v3 [Brachypodium distachyon]